MRNTKHKMNEKAATSERKSPESAERKTRALSCSLSLSLLSHASPTLFGNARETFRFLFFFFLLILNAVFLSYVCLFLCLLFFVSSVLASSFASVWFSLSFSILLLLLLMFFVVVIITLKQKLKFLSQPFLFFRRKNCFLFCL